MSENTLHILIAAAVPLGVLIAFLGRLVIEARNPVDQEIYVKQASAETMKALRDAKRGDAVLMSDAELRSVNWWSSKSVYDCQQCSTPRRPHARFCAKCGTAFL